MNAILAALISANFLVFASSPVKTFPANSTVEIKVGECDGPEVAVA